MTTRTRHRNAAGRALVGLAGGLSVALSGGLSGARADTLTIHDLQVSTAALDWKSAHEGRIISLTGGVVTHAIGFRITLQDPALGDAWAGVEIRAFENEAPLGVVRVGDRVDFHDILVEEFRGGTIPQFKSYSRFEIVSSGNPLPEPVVVSLADIANPPDRERCERYEGMLVAVEDVRIGQMDLGKAEDNYELLGEAQAAWASDYYNFDLAVPPFPKYYVARGERYDRVTGVLQEYSYAEEGWDYYQLLPRGAADYARSAVYSIRDVQESSAGDGWGSLLAGTRISVQGAISAERSASGRLGLCDRLLGALWSGVLVSDPGERLGALLRGDEVLLERVMVAEVDGQTVLRYDDQSDHVLTGGGIPVGAFGLGPASLALGAGPDASEPYEGMLVALYNVAVARCGAGQGDSLYCLAAGGDTLLATDVESGLIPPGSACFVRAGDRLGRIRGLVLEREVPGRGRAYVLAPRGAEDYLFIAAGNALYTSWGRLKDLFR